MGAEAHQVLADGRLGTSERRGELTHRAGAGFKGLDDAKAIRMGQGAQGRPASAQNLGVEAGLLHIFK